MAYQRDYLENTWEQLVEWPEEKWLQLVDTIGEENPVILTYITEIGQEELNEGEEELLLFLGVFVWYVMSQDNGFRINEAGLFEDTRQANEALWEYLIAESDELVDEIIASTIETHSYKEFLLFLAEVIWDDEELNEEEVRAEKRVYLWLYLKIMVESLARKKQEETDNHAFNKT